MESSRRRIAFGGIVVLLLIVTTFAFWNFRERAGGPSSTLHKPVDRRQSPADQIRLTPLYPTEKVATAVFKGDLWASPQLVRLPGRAPFLLIIASSGTVAAVDPHDGQRLWQTELPRSRDEEVFARAGPAQFGDHVMIAYAATSGKTGNVENRAIVLKLTDGKISPEYPTLVFKAEVPATGGGKAVFDSQLHLARAISVITSPSGKRTAYVTFSGTDETQPWHGWLFEIDFDRWRLGFSGNATSSVFVATPEADCNGAEKICGGGMWAYAGPLVEDGPAGPQILVQTGNGRLDLTRNDYAQALVRLEPGLQFQARCDMKLCAGGNPREPSGQCLATCRNVFVPRLLDSDPPLDTPDGACRGKTYLECLDLMDWDFGSSSPVRIRSANHSYYVATGKAGDVFLIDGDVIGRMYDRKQAAPYCGTGGAICRSPYAGLAITQPVATSIDDVPIVVIPTYNGDGGTPAGAVAYRVVGAPQDPKLQEAWRFPLPTSPEARKWFRAPPTRPLMSVVNGDAIVWLAENGRDGHIFAIRARDGKLMAQIRSAGWPMRNALPVIFEDVLFLPAAVQGHENLSWLEAYRITAR